MMGELWIEDWVKGSCHEVLFQHLFGGTEEVHEKLVKLDGFRAKNSAICYHQY
jgi:hypothetical protein